MVIAGFWAAYLIFDVDHYQAVSGIRPLDWVPLKIYTVFRKKHPLTFSFTSP